jgi:hypothetical protein
MKKLIESFDDYPMVSDCDAKDRHNYIRYRLGRLKHEFWLKNRKSKTEIIVDSYDWFILNNLKPGNTCMFGSAGYYVDQLVENLTVVEQWSVVKGFYPNAVIIKDRKDFGQLYPDTFDNFVVINNRGEHWSGRDGLISHIGNYVKSMRPGCVFFYSFRDTQIDSWNRLTVDHYDYFYEIAEIVKQKYGLNLLWHDIQFAHKELLPPNFNEYDIFENPDTTNGNIKFVFQYQDNSHNLDLGFLND